MNKIKIVSMDFDGTLLTSNKKITDRTRNCLLDLKNKSYIIIGVTARNLLSVKYTLDINLFDYIILNNGANIYRVREDKIENIKCIDDKIVKEIFDLFKDNSSQIDFCTPYNYLIRTNSKYDSRPFITYIENYDDINTSISRINLFFSDILDIEDNIKLIENKFNCFDIVKMIDTDKANSRKWITLNPKNINKLSTLERLCDELKCNLNEVIFFGDGENDLVLIENAGISVAMGNAVDIVKEKASFVTSSNDNDGVAKFLEKKLF